MNLILRALLRILAGFSLAMALLAVPGCGVVEQQIVNYRSMRQYNSEHQELVRGHEAFQKEDYKKALEIFDNLRYRVRNDDIVRHAMFGLACTHFVLAETPEEFQEAIALWKTWTQLMPASMGGEDPRMLDQVLYRKSLHLKAETMTESASKSTKLSQYQKQLKTKEEEIHNLKQKLKAREEEIVTLREQNTGLKHKEAELEKLRNQINAIEAIEQKIQKKKKKMTTQ